MEDVRILSFIKELFQCLVTRTIVILKMDERYYFNIGKLFYFIDCARCNQPPADTDTNNIEMRKLTQTRVTQI